MRRFIARTAIKALFLFGLCGAFAGCFGKPEMPLRVGAIVWPGYEGLFLARSLGYFEGQPVKLVEYRTVSEVIRSFENGAIEAACLSTDELLRLSVNEPDAQAILVMDISKGADALLARPELQEVKDLKGKRVGVEVNSMGVYMLARALDKAGLRAEDIVVAQVSHNSHESAYLGGEVDAVVTSEPHRTPLMNAGAKVIFDSSQLSEEITDVLVVKRGLVEKRRHDLQNLVKSWFRAVDYMKQHPERSAQIMAEREGISPGDLMAAMKLLEIPSLEKNRKWLASEKAATYARLRKVEEIMFKAGIQKGTGIRTNLLEGGVLP